MDIFFWEQTLPTFIVAAGLVVCGLFVSRPFLVEIVNIFEGKAND